MAAAAIVELFSIVSAAVVMRFCEVGLLMKIMTFREDQKYRPPLSIFHGLPLDRWLCKPSICGCHRPE